MKKSKLIALLQQIEGDPDIYLWNGFVQDYMDIKALEESLLVKETKEHVYQHMRFDYMRRVGRFELTDEEEAELRISSLEAWKEHYNKWDFPNPNVTEAEFNEWHGNNKKRIFLITAKPRGKSTWDRQGYMSY